MDLTTLVGLIGLPEALLCIAVVHLWREWRKSENRIVELLQRQIEDKGETVGQYSRFENTIKELTATIKGE